MRRLAEEGGLGIAAVLLHFNVELGDLREHLLALTDIDKVEEICHGLGVIDAGAACDEHGCVLITF